VANITPVNQNAKQQPRYTFSNPQLALIIAEIEQAMQWHDMWYKQLLRSLIADTPANSKDLRDDAHLKCQFGQWFATLSDDKLNSHPLFAKIGDAHIKMHQGAKSLLSLKASKQAVPVDLLDQFHHDLDELRELFIAISDEFYQLMHSRDPLTGATNRINLLANLHKEQDLCKRKEQHCALVMLDLDHFKAVNDQYGHATGDKVLVAIVKCLQSHLRSYDQLYRYGGEEFLLCLTQTTVSEARLFAERLRQAIAALNIAVAEDITISVTGSFGVAQLNANTDVETTIAEADKAMYAAKAAGRNRVK
tara:strand:- start:2253 stop:3170 length:918 start_codon:yes stop_codon:yes gene_type:complete